MIKPKTRITSFPQTGVHRDPSGYQLLLHRPPVNEKRQCENENCYETWITPSKLRSSIIVITAAASIRMLLYILFISCPLFVVNCYGPLTIPTQQYGFTPIASEAQRSSSYGPDVHQNIQERTSHDVYRLRWEICQAFIFQQELPSGCTGCSCGQCWLARNTDQRETGTKRGELHPDPATLPGMLGR